MKMETVIRSPQKGVVAKLVHKEGVSVTCLVKTHRSSSLICIRTFAKRAQC
jgi:hypothetical protein